MKKRLCKSRKDRKIFGVCGGIANYFDVDPTLVRIITLVLCLISVGTCIVVYLVAALIMPDEDMAAENDDDIDNMKRANVDSEQKSKSSEHSENCHSDKDFNSHF